MEQQTWELLDHLCMACGGRILKCVTGNGMTPGGNPIYRCANCSASTWAMGPEKLCWCGQTHRSQNIKGYICVPFSILEKRPELLKHFLACGCDPKRSGDVGIMLRRDFKEEA